mgnify:CR=1 FL=1|tara:strand:+ start:1818 stop:2381 length:564 start_codon:yes stop_codon:yes gene_type:complete
MKGFFEEQDDSNFLEDQYPKKQKPQVFNMASSSNKKFPAVTPCECKMGEGQESIVCNRHKCIKSKSLHGLCKYKQSYFDLWESGEGPMQDMITQGGFDRSATITKEEAEDKEQKFFMGDPEIPLKSRGLGDTLAKFNKVTGVKKVVKTVFDAFNKDCGCSERQRKINKMFPYKNGQQEITKTKGFFD